MDLRLDNILNTMASSMSAESIRMNVIASNLANTGSVGTTEDQTYHARHPVFSTITESVMGLDQEDQAIGGVRVTDVLPSQKPLDWHYEPNNPLADKDGRVYITDVNLMEEMADMISASRQYQASAEVISTARNLLTKTIRMIEQG